MKGNISPIARKLLAEFGHKLTTARSGAKFKSKDGKTYTLCKGEDMTMKMK